MKWRHDARPPLDQSAVRAGKTNDSYRFARIRHADAAGQVGKGKERVEPGAGRGVTAKGVDRDGRIFRLVDGVRNVCSHRIVFFSGSCTMELVWR